MLPCKISQYNAVLIFLSLTPITHYSYLLILHGKKYQLIDFANFILANSLLLQIYSLCSLSHITIPHCYRLKGCTCKQHIVSKEVLLKQQKSLHRCLSKPEKVKLQWLRRWFGHDMSACNNKHCRIRLPPAFRANCLHSNTKRPRLRGILKDLLCERKEG